MQKVKVETLIWDCDNTIWIHRKDEVELISKHLGIEDVATLKVQFFQWIKNFNDFFEERLVTTGRIEKFVERNMPILEAYNISAGKFLKEMAEVETSFLNNEAIETLKYFYGEGYKNIVLTDWIAKTQLKLLKKYDILQYFEEIHTCDEFYIKKNPRAKERVIKEGKEDSYIMIGDSLESDIAFANVAGIKSIWYNRNGSKNNTKFVPTYEIRSMKELYEIIEWLKRCKWLYLAAYSVLKIYEQKFEKTSKKLLTNWKKEYKICSTKANKNLQKTEFY